MPSESHAMSRTIIPKISQIKFQDESEKQERGRKIRKTKKKLELEFTLNLNVDEVGKLNLK